MRAVQEFLQCEAGHVVVSFVLLLLGVGMWAVHAPHSDEVIIGGSTLIGRSMIGLALTKDNKQ